MTGDGDDESRSSYSTRNTTYSEVDYERDGASIPVSEVHSEIDVR